MQIHVNTDDNIQGREALAEKVRGQVERALARFRDQLTRVDVHLSDVNSGKSGDADKRCLVEARAAGLPPVVVSHQAPALLDAIQAAMDKAVRALESAAGRRQDRKGGESIRREGAP